MKFKVVIGIIIFIAVIVLTTSGEGVQYTKEKVEVIVEVTPEWASDEDAVKAAQDVIRKKALETELVELNKSFASSTEAYEAEKKSYNEKKTNLEKSLGTYWREEANIKRLIRETFPEDPETAIAVAMAESGLVMQQSKHNYPKNMDGQKAGSREMSWCIYQIHEPAHAATAARLGYENYKTDVEDCVKMARVVYEQAGGWSPWTVYQKKMHLAYVR